MKISISFRNFDHSQALDERIREKSKKLIKYFGDDIKVDWICWIEHGSHYAEVNLRQKQHDFNAKAHSPNLYHSLDKVMDKIENQIHHIH